MLGPTVAVLLHLVNGQNAKTTQFPPRSLNGFGILEPSEYGPPHIAIPTPRVSVGTIYSLNCDDGVGRFPSIPPAPAGFGGRTNGVALVGNESIGNPFPSV